MCVRWLHHDVMVNILLREALALHRETALGSGRFGIGGSSSKTPFYLLNGKISRQPRLDSCQRHPLKKVGVPTMMEETELTEEVKPPPAQPLADIEDDDPEDKETKRKRERERSFWTKLWQGVAAGSLAVNIAAMVFVSTGVTIAMGVIACIVAPIVIVQQMKLQDTDSEF